MDKEEYYSRIEKINNKFRTDRISADEEYQLVCQRNYLSIKYIANLEQQVKRLKEAIDNAIKCIEEQEEDFYPRDVNYRIAIDILKEVSE